MTDEVHSALTPQATPAMGGFHTVSRTVTWMLGRGAPTYAILALGLSVLKYGAGLYPSWNVYQALARNWHDPHASPLLQSPNDYRLADPVSADLAAWFHLTGDRAFLAFHLALALAAIVTPFAFPAVKRSAELRLAIFLLLIGSAVPAVLLNWIGSYDPVTLAAAAMAVLALNPVVAAIGWGVFALNNSLEAAVAFAIVAVVLIADQRRDATRRLAFGAAGLIVGYIWIQIAISQWGGAASQPTLMRYYGFARFATNPENFWPLIFVSALGAGWVFVAARDVRVLLPAQLFTGLAIAASIVLPFLVLDDSRIISTVLWPGLMLIAVIVVRRVPGERVHDLLGMLMPIALLIVLVLVWDGHLVYAGWGALLHLVQYIFGHSTSPFLD
jgi:hypothetical protein